MIPSENEEGAKRWRKTEKEAAKTVANLLLAEVALVFEDIKVFA